MAHMHFAVLTLFPEMFTGFLRSSMMKRAIEQKRITTQLVNFRDYATDKHHTVDDTPYGGGDGMVLKPEPIFAAVEAITESLEEKPPVLLMSPQGKPFTQETAVRLAGYQHLILICGHYAGFDERVRQHLATEEISIGDYVLTGGELPAMVIMDSISRLIPGVLGNQISAQDDSFATGLLEYPQYTRPLDFRGYRVPEILLSGHHQRIAEWRRKQSLKATYDKRPDLLDKAPLSESDRQFLSYLSKESKE